MAEENEILTDSYLHEVMSELTSMNAKLNQMGIDITRVTGTDFRNIPHSEDPNEGIRDALIPPSLPLHQGQPLSAATRNIKPTSSNPDEADQFERLVEVGSEKFAKYLEGIFADKLDIKENLVKVQQVSAELNNLLKIANLKGGEGAQELIGNLSQKEGFSKTALPKLDERIKELQGKLGEIDPNGSDQDIITYQELRGELLPLLDVKRTFERVIASNEKSRIPSLISKDYDASGLGQIENLIGGEITPGALEGIKKRVSEAIGHIEAGDKTVIDGIGSVEGRGRIESVRQSISTQKDNLEEELNSTDSEDSRRELVEKLNRLTSIEDLFKNLTVAGEKAEGPYGQVGSLVDPATYEDSLKQISDIAEGDFNQRNLDLARNRLAQARRGIKYEIPGALKAIGTGKGVEGLESIEKKAESARERLVGELGGIGDDTEKEAKILLEIEGLDNFIGELKLTKETIQENSKNFTDGVGKTVASLAAAVGLQQWVSTRFISQPYQYETRPALDAMGNAGMMGELLSGSLGAKESVLQEYRGQAFSGAVGLGGLAGFKMGGVGGAFIGAGAGMFAGSMLQDPLANFLSAGMDKEAYQAEMGKRVLDPQKFTNDFFKPTLQARMGLGLGSGNIAETLGGYASDDAKALGYDAVVVSQMLGGALSSVGPALSPTQENASSLIENFAGLESFGMDKDQIIGLMSDVSRAGSEDWERSLSVLLAATADEDGKVTDYTANVLVPALSKVIESRAIQNIARSSEEVERETAALYSLFSKSDTNLGKMLTANPEMMSILFNAVSQISETAVQDPATMLFLNSLGVNFADVITGDINALLKPLDFFAKDAVVREDGQVDLMNSLGPILGFLTSTGMGVTAPNIQLTKELFEARAKGGGEEEVNAIMEKFSSEDPTKVLANALSQLTDRLEGIAGTEAGGVRRNLVEQANTFYQLMEEGAPNMIAIQQAIMTVLSDSESLLTTIQNAGIKILEELSKITGVDLSEQINSMKDSRDQRLDDARQAPLREALKGAFTEEQMEAFNALPEEEQRSFLGNLEMLESTYKNLNRTTFKYEGINQDRLTALLTEGIPNSRDESGLWTSDNFRRIGSQEVPAAPIRNIQGTLAAITTEAPTANGTTTGTTNGTDGTPERDEEGGVAVTGASGDTNGETSIEFNDSGTGNPLLDAVTRIFNENQLTNFNNLGASDQGLFLSSLDSIRPSFTNRQDEIDDNLLSKAINSEILSNTVGTNWFTQFNNNDNIRTINNRAVSAEDVTQLQGFLEKINSDESTETPFVDGQMPTEVPDLDRFLERFSMDAIAIELNQEVNRGRQFTNSPRFDNKHSEITGRIHGALMANNESITENEINAATDELRRDSGYDSVRGFNITSLREFFDDRGLLDENLSALLEAYSSEMQDLILNQIMSRLAAEKDKPLDERDMDMINWAINSGSGTLSEELGRPLDYSTGGFTGAGDGIGPVGSATGGNTEDTGGLDNFRTRVKNTQLDGRANVYRTGMGVKEGEMRDIYRGNRDFSEFLIEVDAFGDLGSLKFYDVDRIRREYPDEKLTDDLISGYKNMVVHSIMQGTAAVLSLARHRGEDENSALESVYSKLNPVRDILGFENFGFSTGGFTGAGGRLDPVGVVHGGEYVISDDRVSQNRRILDRIQAGENFDDITPFSTASTAAGDDVVRITLEFSNISQDEIINAVRASTISMLRDERLI